MINICILTHWHCFISKASRRNCERVLLDIAYQRSTSNYPKFLCKCSRDIGIKLPLCGEHVATGASIVSHISVSTILYRTAWSHNFTNVYFEAHGIWQPLLCHMKCCKVLPQDQRKLGFYFLFSNTPCICEIAYSALRFLCSSLVFGQIVNRYSGHTQTTHPWYFLPLSFASFSVWMTVD
jgi:hypothetical protein